ncbi:3-isopropylmalate dehydrogenase [Neolewinella lacunae]|uniref:3-isopropylmalate dehydrogenase n=1 Tax=Neolewinella lacunae TaxID=1517758 RepID=A0A923PMB4_9BACT|nr:3-isopropylmalate dehydrogenase [Neolewinella lacunae]MBC6996707.1 3-isopropylmalate dehydrogenase [Neolewinella lacunae]MDN3633428.1 3-isopropylmalate dehydrogenase [Neolewinella lacunae]
MGSFKIAVLDGDGIGPEVIKQGIKVLDRVGVRFGHTFHYHFAPVGAVAIDQTGDPLPPETLALCKESDAIFFGAIGHPRFDNDPTLKVRPEQGLLRLRKELGLYANLRPVAGYAQLTHLSPLRPERMVGVDMLIVRELTGGTYFGEKGRRDGGNTAYDTCIYSRAEVERIVQVGFEAARNRRGKLTLVDKANVMESSRLWREVTQEMAANNPDVALNYMFVDNAAMQLILNPAQFDVIVTDNLFGDILSDASSVLAGSLGLLPSSSVGAAVGMFEPIHGSWPEGAGQDRANPVATILSAAMLLDHLGLVAEGDAVRHAVNTTLESGVGTEDLHPQHKVGTNAMGDLIADALGA